ncbi:MAG: winged helix-turn-helix domain-containing protein [Phycisphaerae bacterium]|nr:winged helix-turn-helix domain-containing protein [Phycisphaerae bacterium]
MTTTKKPAKKTGEGLRKEAIAAVGANIARLEAPRRAPKGKPARDYETPTAKEAANDAANAAFAKGETGAKPPRKAKGGAKPAHGPTSAATAGPKAGGKGKPKAAKSAAKGRKMSGLDAAAKILADSGKAMNCADIVEAARSKGLWSSSGKTPAATVYAAIIREIAAKGKAARFRKTERGMFVAARGA